ncbi:MAG: CRISPR-associated endonuclease Cas3'' [Methanobrevibacter sp.]|jgi:CRISPR-associated endonuclease/helicase Cas3|nr:CRISPR-associated endonuclease Cas3'' [Candidatus Methanoflexus mossambicus]
MSSSSNSFSCENNSNTLKNNIFSHPNKPLVDHLLNVANFSEYIILNSKFENHEFLSKISFLIGISHDFAKTTSFFQKYLFDHKQSTKKAHHGFLSGVFAYYLVKKFINSSFIDSFYRNNKNNNNFNIELLPIISYLIVLRHHGNLKNIKNANGEIEHIQENFDNLEIKIKDLKTQLNTEKFKKIIDFYENIFNKKYNILFNINIKDFINNYFSLQIDIINDLMKKLLISKDISIYLLILLLFSALLDGDKLDASNTAIPKRKQIIDDIVDKYKENHFKNKTTINDINKIREESYNEVISSIDDMDFDKNRIFSLELPTGCGKTLTAFSYCLKLREKINSLKGFTPRIIYSLPFLSIIDQNEEVIRNILNEFDYTGSDILLKHNYLSDMNYKTDEFEYNQNSSQLLTEGWNSEIIVTTFIQFFYSIISNKNRSIRKFHNITNSIILLDEIQSVPYEFWPSINSILTEISNKFNCWIILMTATQPLIFSEEKHEIIPLIKEKENYFNNFNRMTFHFDLEKKTIEDFQIEALKTIKENPDKDIMFVLNTINTSKELYGFLKNELINDNSDLELNPEETNNNIDTNNLNNNENNDIKNEFEEFTLENISNSEKIDENEYYEDIDFDDDDFDDEDNNLEINEKSNENIFNSSISNVSSDGILKIDDETDLIYLSTKILPKHRLSKIKHIKESKNRKIIVSTQLIEAGVDISVDIIYRDLAPFDCIVQTGGRCNRNNGQEKGELRVINLVNEKNRAFGSFVYNNILIQSTKNAINDVEYIKEKDIYKYSKKYYSKLLEYGTQDKSIKLLELIQSLDFTYIPKDFKLLDNKHVPEADIFVIVDDNAQEIFNRYDQIKTENKDPLKRKNEFLKMKGEFYNYVISINRNQVGRVEKYGKFLGYISKDLLNDKYDLETGFIDAKDEEPFIL